MAIHPSEIFGNWDKGYVLDEHTISSTPAGEDAYGHMLFKTIRSELGELLYQFKYRYRHNNLELIMEEIIPFIDEWQDLKNIDTVIPVPPSKQRMYQPAEEIAQAISDYLGKSYHDDILQKDPSFQAKDLDGNKELLTDAIHVLKHAKREQNILLVDDLYSTGRTLDECVKALRKDKNIKYIYVLTMTKTKKR